MGALDSCHCTLILLQSRASKSCVHVRLADQSIRPLGGEQVRGKMMTNEPAWVFFGGPRGVVLINSHPSDNGCMGKVDE